MELRNSGLNTSENKKRNSSVNKKKSEISAATIINSLERDIADLIQESAVRTQKNKLISLNETFKLLSKKINSPSTDIGINNLSNNSYNIATKRANSIIMDNSFSNRNENLPNTSSNLKSQQNKLISHEDVEAEIKRAYELELRKIKDDKMNEIDQIKKRDILNETEIFTLRKEKEDIVHRLNARIEVLNNYYTDEKAKNNQLLIKIKSLEDTFKTLNNEYLSLNFKYNKTQTDTENMEKSLLEVRKSNHDTKYKFEDLIKINNELKQRLIEYENSAKLHQDDLKNILKRNSNLQKSLEEIERSNKQLISELSYKEERLRAIRFMNQKMEQKSQQILKKWDTFKRYEEKASEMIAYNSKMLEVIEELNNKINLEKEEKENLKQSFDSLGNEKFQMSNEIEELNSQIINLKNVNDELVNRNKDLEIILKDNLDIRSEYKESSRGSKENFKSNTLMKMFTLKNNINQENNSNIYGNDVSLEKMNPAKLIVNDNNMVEIQH